MNEPGHPSLLCPDEIRHDRGFKIVESTLWKTLTLKNYVVRRNRVLKLSRNGEYSHYKLHSAPQSPLQGDSDERKRVRAKAGGLGSDPPPSQQQSCCCVVPPSYRKDGV